MASRLNRFGVLGRVQRLLPRGDAPWVTLDVAFGAPSTLLQVFIGDPRIQQDVTAHVQPGDLVLCEGQLRHGPINTGSQTVFSTYPEALRFQILARSPAKDSAAEQKEAVQATA